MGHTCLQGPFLCLQRPQLQQKKIERRLQRFQLEASIIASIGLPLSLSPPLLSPLPLSFLSSPQRRERERGEGKRGERESKRERKEREQRERGGGRGFIYNQQIMAALTPLTKRANVGALGSAPSMPAPASTSVCWESTYIMSSANEPALSQSRSLPFPSLDY